MKENNPDKINIRRTLGYVLLIGITAQMTIQIGEGIATGFVLALDVIVFGAYAFYMKSTGRILAVTVLTAIASPLSRLIFTYSTFESLRAGLLEVFPDGVFFLAYGLVLWLVNVIYKKRIESDALYSVIISFCDTFGNVFDYACRGLVFRNNSPIGSSVSTFIIMGMFRACIVFVIITIIRVVVEYNLNNERWKNVIQMYDNLTTLSEQIVMMKKNSEEVEKVMKKAYDLNTELSEGDYPEELSRKAQEIAVRTHEVKGEYKNLMLVMNELFDSKDDEQAMAFDMLCKIVISNVEAFKNNRGQNAIITTDLKYNFVVFEPYKILSIVRNLVTNAVEAVDRRYEEVRIYTDIIDEEGTSKIVIGVKDFGPGIEEADIANIFLTGYSTKFNIETGYIQRGLGLTLVKQYVEEHFGGRIEVKSKAGSYTDFKIILDSSRFGELDKPNYTVSIYG